MSRDDDVIDRCADDAKNSNNSPTRHFYLMTSLDDDITEDLKPELRSMDSQCSLNTRRDTKYTDNDDDDDDDRLASSDNSALQRYHETILYHENFFQHSHPGTFRAEDQTTLNVLEQIDGDHVLIITQDPDVTLTTATEQHNSLPLTTNQQPISDDTGTGNGIRYDRKLIDEIDAAMAHAQKDGHVTLRRHSDHVTQDSAHIDHVTRYSEHDSRDLEECGSRSRGKRGHHRLSVTSKHQQTITADTAGLLLAS